MSKSSHNSLATSQRESLWCIMFEAMSDRKADLAAIAQRLKVFNIPVSQLEQAFFIEVAPFYGWYALGADGKNTDKSVHLDSISLVKGIYDTLYQVKASHHAKLAYCIQVRFMRFYMNNVWRQIAEHLQKN